MKTFSRVLLHRKVRKPSKKLALLSAMYNRHHIRTFKYTFKSNYYNIFLYVDDVTPLQVKKQVWRGEVAWARFHSQNVAEPGT